MARSGSLAPSLTEIIDRHTKAVGGAAALDSVRSKWVSLTITEKGQAIDGVYQCVGVPEWRIDVYAGGKHVFCEGLDRRGPWLWPGSDPAPKNAAADARRTGIQGIEFHLYGLHRFRSRGHQLFLDAPQTIDATRYYVIRVLMRDAYETFLFINPTTFLIDRRRDQRAPHPDLDPTRKFLETRYSDYRPVDGIMTAYLEDQYNLTDGTLVNRSAVKQVHYNGASTPQAFDRTAHFQATI
ncbi:MAG: hypothetical protein ACJ8FT_11840 [Sphingomonas sp.]